MACEYCFKFKESDEKKEAYSLREDIFRIIHDKNFTPDKLIDFLEEHFFPYAFRKIPYKEKKLTLREHTTDVLNIFEKYFSYKGFYFLRLVLALHDIGTPRAFGKGGREHQKKYNDEFINKFLNDLGFSDTSKKLFLSILNNDVIFKYITQKASLTETIQKVIDISEQVGMNPSMFFEIMLMYYMSDAASYSEENIGFKILDHLFEKDEVNNTLKFNSVLEGAIDEVRNGIELAVFDKEIADKYD